MTFPLTGTQITLFTLISRLFRMYSGTPVALRHFKANSDLYLSDKSFVKVVLIKSENLQTLSASKMHLELTVTPFDPRLNHLLLHFLHEIS